MKKIFTLLLCSALFAGACWGDEYIIGTGSNASENAPSKVKSAYSFCEMLYTASQLSTAGLTSGKKITTIAFRFRANTTLTRQWDVYITTSSSTKLLDMHAVSSQNKVYSGDVEIKQGWCNIVLNESITWNGTSALQISVYDRSNNAISTSFGREFYYTATSNNQIAYTNGNNPYDPTSYISNTNLSKDLPQIKFITESSTPVASLDATCDITNFGTFAKAYETKQATITVTGENLTEDVSITAETGSGISLSTPTLTKEDVMKSGGAQVIVSTTSSFVTGKKVTISANNKSKVFTFTGTEASFTEKSTIGFLNNNTAVGDYVSLTASSSSISSVDATHHTFEIRSYSDIATIDYEAVPGTYTVGGTISGLKAKKTDSNSYKALAFNYTAPSSIITIYENQDNTATLADHAGSENIALSRSTLLANMYNPICLPFNVSSTQLGTRFAGCDIIQLKKSTYQDDAINLEFETATEIIAGNPYFIDPKNQDISYLFSSGYALVNTTGNTIETDYVDFVGIINPTALPQSKEILFMGKYNQLYWPTEAGTLKGLRCYFQVKNTAASGAPVRMVINKDNNTTELVEMQNASRMPDVHKFVNNGQLRISRNGVIYNATGQIIK